MSPFKRTAAALAFTLLLAACTGGSDARPGGAARPGAGPGGRSAQASACDMPTGSSRRRAATPAPSRRGRGAAGRVASLDRSDCAPAP
jgi:hypothetical protein